MFLAAAGQSVVNIGKGAAAVVTDPAGTAKGFGAGVKRFAANLGRRTQRAVEAVSDEEPSAEGAPGGKESAAKGILGVTSPERRWARKVNVDPYTTNPVLRQTLEDVAKVDAAGSIATKVVVPVPAAVGLFIPERGKLPRAVDGVALFDAECVMDSKGGNGDTRDEI